MIKTFAMKTPAQKADSGLESWLLYMEEKLALWKVDRASSDLVKRLQKVHNEKLVSSVVLNV